MKSFAWKSLMCVVAGVALAGCAELDVRGRGTIGAPPGTGVGQTAGEGRHADERDEDKDKHRRKHKHKDHREGDDDDDNDDDDHRNERHHKD